MRLVRPECGARFTKAGTGPGDQGHCKALAAYSEWEGKSSGGFSGGVKLIIYMKYMKLIIYIYI